MAKKCLERGADVNLQKRGQTCLMVAVKAKNSELVSLLLEQPGINVNAVDLTLRGETVLHKAAQSFCGPAILRMLLDFPGIDGEARDGRGQTPLMRSYVCGDAAQFAEFLKTPKILLSGMRVPSYYNLDLQFMLDNEQKKREDEKEEKRRNLEKVEREEKKKKDSKRKRKVFNEAEKWKKMQLARRRQKAAVQELVRKNKEAEEEMSKEGMMRKERAEKEFQDRIDAFVREIEDQKQKMVVQMDQELVNRKESLSKENQDKQKHLEKKHNAENLDMFDNMLDNEDDNAKEDAEEEEDAVQAVHQAPAAPDCPICYELMTPPTRIFQCGAGHLVCAACRPRLQVFQLPNFLPKWHLFIQEQLISEITFLFSGMPKQMWPANVGPCYWA